MNGSDFNLLAENFNQGSQIAVAVVTPVAPVTQVTETTSTNTTTTTVSSHTHKKDKNPIRRNGHKE